MSGWQSWDVIRCEVEKKNLRLFLNGLLNFVETQFNIDTCWFPHAGATRGHAHRLLREQLDEASLSWYIQRIFRFDPIPTTFMIFCFTSERVNLVCVCVYVWVMLWLRLAFSIGAGYSTVKHSRLVGQVYDSDLVASFGVKIWSFFCWGYCNPQM